MEGREGEKGKRRKILISEFPFTEHKTWGEEQEEPGVRKENQNFQVLDSFSFRQQLQDFWNQPVERVSLCRSSETLGTSAPRQ